MPQQTTYKFNALYDGIVIAIQQYEIAYKYF